MKRCFWRKNKIKTYKRVIHEIKNFTRKAVSTLPKFYYYKKTAFLVFEYKTKYRLYKSIEDKKIQFYHTSTFIEKNNSVGFNKLFRSKSTVQE